MYQKEFIKIIMCIVAYDNENWIRIYCELIDEAQKIRAKETVIEEFEW